MKDISIDVRSGEIVGIFGLMGAGRSEVVRAAFGVDPIEAGSVWVNGKEYSRPTPFTCIENNMAFITENRREEGLMMPKTVVENLALVKIRELTGNMGVVNAKKERSATEEAIASVGVRSAPIPYTSRSTAFRAATSRRWSSANG